MDSMSNAGLKLPRNRKDDRRDPCAFHAGCVRFARVDFGFAGSARFAMLPL